MFGSKTIKFTIFSSNRKNIYQNNSKLDLICHSVDELESWKASLLRAGVYPEYQAKETSDVDEVDSGSVSSGDPQLERQVETIRTLVDSYMQIVMKTLKDLSPKVVMMLIINDVKVFIAEELLATLYAECDMKQLTEESPEEEERREELLKMYASLKEALQIIGEINVQTVHAPPPPPVDNSWIQNSPPQQKRPPPPEPKRPASRKPPPKAPPKRRSSVATPQTMAPQEIAPQVTPQMAGSVVGATIGAGFNMAQQQGLTTQQTMQAGTGLMQGLNRLEINPMQAMNTMGQTPRVPPRPGGQPNANDIMNMFG